MTPHLTSLAGRLTLRAGREGRATAELSIGLGSLPFLADHGFGGMAVLPGSLYIEAARLIERELAGRAPTSVGQVRFERPVLVGQPDTTLRIEVRPDEKNRVAYTFHELDGSTVSRVARLVVERGALDALGPATSTAGLAARAPRVIAPEDFYAALRDNGNHYGPTFRGVSALRLGQGSALAEMHEPRDVPIVLDCMSQVLAALFLERGRTFVLRSIESIRLAPGELPAALRIHAVPAEDAGDDGSFTGAVRAVDPEGRPVIELAGVACALLERADAARVEQRIPTCVIAANFTAEPLADALEFWADQLDAPLAVEFAPHDQVFQQLLDPASALARNRGGTSAVLLDLEAWSGAGDGGATHLERLEGRGFGQLATYRLPNGLEIAELNRHETDYLYREIFEEQTYLRHGIELPERAIVLDVGANIGMFSLFVMSRAKDARILAFEPAPAAYERLAANCEAYGTNVRTVQAGLGERPGTATLTYYEASSVFSGFHADEMADREAIRAVVRRALDERGPLEPTARERYVEELTAERLRGTKHECRVTTVSEILRQHGLERVDLLKIDAEKSEAEILRGIEDADWPKLRQIVLEVHDASGSLVQELEWQLGERGFRCTIQRERALAGSGLCTLYATRPDLAASDAAPRPGELERNVRELASALGAFAARARSPLVLLVGPRSPAVQADPRRRAALDAAERTLGSAAAALSGVTFCGSAALASRYPVASPHDAEGLRLGRMPYTAEGYAAIGTALYRAMFGLRRAPFKVLVLDCDNTLWDGVAAEDGPQGVEIDEPHRKLQELALRQREAGVLLCLCSKNEESDVLAVLEHRSDVLLAPRHLTSWRINWTSKSENLLSLAQELDLGQESFVFVDDNPVECAEVRARCPGVLTFELPQDPRARSLFLDHVWVFDPVPATDEDKRRARMYEEHAQRERFRGESGSLRDFLAGLELRVRVADMTEEQLARVSQLTFRTNQFNSTTIRRSEGEIRELLSRPGAGCLVVHVADRFGDYGLVGVVLHRVEADALHVDTFLLSCRVLGRGVEHVVLAALARRAAEAGRARIVLAYRATERNAPVREFLHGLSELAAERSDGCFSFRPERLVDLAYDPDRESPDRAMQGPEAPAAAPSPAQLATASRAAALQRIADRLHDAESIAHAIAEHRAARAGQPAASPTAPAGTLETTLLGIWSRVLGRPGIGTDDNFFDVGGSSMRAVQVLAAIQKELGRTLSIVSLFECPTVRQLAARLAAPTADTALEAAASRARERGERRRMARRRTA